MANDTPLEYDPSDTGQEMSEFIRKQHVGMRNFDNDASKIPGMEGYGHNPRTPDMGPLPPYRNGGAVTARGAQTLAKIRARHSSDV